MCSAAECVFYADIVESIHFMTLEVYDPTTVWNLKTIVSGIASVNELHQRDTFLFVSA